MPSSFGVRLADAFVAHGQLCVGIDPHSALLEDWGLADDISGLESFSNTVIDESAGRVGIIKPQVSFFERFGSKGFAVLEAACERATEAGLLVIMDIKRGDIGSTMDGYFAAWLGQSAPFICDAVTVSPYLGFDSLKPFMAAATERGKGVFVLAATSNPEAAVLQQAMVTEDTSVAASVWQGLESVNRITALPGQSIGSFGAVLGATLNLSRFGMGHITSTAQSVATPILAPGFGAQGARLADAGRLFGVAAHQTIASVSRSVLQAGPIGLDNAIDAAKNELQEGLA